MAESVLRSHRARRPRSGVAATELAVCMPVIVLVVIATMEACAMIFLQQSLSIAAYESTRIALTPEATAADVQQQGSLILTNRGVKQGSVTVTPGSFSAAAPGSWIRVETRAPFAKNSFLGGWLFAGRTLQAATEMVKEN